MRGSLRRAVASVPIGVVSLSEAFTSEPDPATFAAMVQQVTDLLAPIELAHGIASATRAARAQMLGTSGTVTTLAAVLLGLPRYDRRVIDGLRVDPDAIVCGLAAAARHGQRQPRGASLHRPGSRRSRGRRLRDPGGGPAMLAGRPACGSRTAACARACCTA